MELSFDANGNPQPYRAIELSLEQFENIFAEIEDKEKRKELFLQLKKYLNRFEQEVSPISLWIMLFDGSYTTNKREPNDIDFVSVVDFQTCEQKEEEIKSLTTAGQYSKGYDIRKHWHLDAYVLPFYPPSDKRFIVTLVSVLYWTRWFGLDRNQRPKAVLVIKLINKENVALGREILRAIQDEGILTYAQLFVRSQGANGNFTVEEIQNYLEW